MRRNCSACPRGGLYAAIARQNEHKNAKCKGAAVRGGAQGGRQRETDARKPRHRLKNRHRLSCARSRTPKEEDLKTT